MAAFTALERRGESLDPVSSVFYCWISQAQILVEGTRARSSK